MRGKIAVSTELELKDVARGFEGMLTLHSLQLTAYSLQLAFRSLLVARISPLLSPLKPHR